MVTRGPSPWTWTRINCNLVEGLVVCLLDTTIAMHILVRSWAKFFLRFVQDFFRASFDELSYQYLPSTMIILENILARTPLLDSAYDTG